MKPRRILLFDHTARLGGGEIALLRLVSALDKERFSPVVLLGEDGPLYRELLELGIETHLLPLDASVAQTRKDRVGPRTLLQARTLSHILRYAWNLAAFIRKNRMVLLHTNSLKADLIGALAARIKRIPLLWHIRDRIASDYLPPVTAAAFRLGCGWLPTRIAANSQATLDTLTHRARMRGTVVYDGIPAPQTQSPPVPSAPPIVGILGRITPWKGQHLFLHAARQILLRHPEVRFRIIGSPLFGEDEYEQELRLLSEKLGICHAVEFTGFQNDIQRSIENLSVVVHASTLPEPFGQVVLEAMAYGRPVVAVRAGGVPEIVEDGKSGLLVSIGDPNAIARAVESILDDPCMAARLTENGRLRATQKFNIRHTARAIESIYENLLGS